MGYMGHFIVYLLAMIGLIILALFVYKKFSCGTIGRKTTHMLNIEDTLSLSPRKTLYVISNGSERFLIAADADRTTLISRLENGANIEKTDDFSNKTRTIRKTRELNRNIDLSEQAILGQDNIAPIKKPIMREIRTKLNF